METSIPRDVLADFGAALSDPVRAEILLALRFGPSNPNELARRLSITRQCVTKHLARLSQSGVVVASSHSGKNQHALADPHFGRLLNDLADMMVAVRRPDTQL